MGFEVDDIVFDFTTPGGNVVFDFIESGTDVLCSWNPSDAIDAVAFNGITLMGEWEVNFITGSASCWNIHMNRSQLGGSRSASLLELIRQFQWRDSPCHTLRFQALCL